MNTLKTNIQTETTKNKVVKLDAPTRKNAGGIAGGLEYVGASLAAGVGGVFEGTYDLVAGSLAALTGNKAYAENLFGTNVVGEWHKNIADGYNPNKAMKFVGDVSSGLGQSATMLIPGAGVPLFFAGAIGGGIGSATEKTGELGFKEYAYGTTVGVIEGLLETYLSSAGQALDKVTKGATKSLMTKLTSQIAKDWAASAVWKGVAKDLISNAAGEFFEEAISEAIDPVLQRGFRIDEDASTSMKEILYAGLVGFGSGLVMGGASTAISTGTAYKVGKRSIDNGNAELVVRDAHTVIDALKIDENTKDIAPYLEGLKSSLESYELAADKKSDAATIYLGQVQGYMSAVESSWAVLQESTKLAGVSENAAKSFAEFMSYADRVGDVSKNYTAQDWYSDKNKIRTRYAAFKWAGAFLGDTVEMAESVAFDEAIRADREGREVGMPLVKDITGKEFTGESGTYYVGANLDAGPAPEGDYLRIIKLQDGTYSIGRGNSSEQVRGYRGLTREAAQAEFERIKGAVAAERSKVAQNQNLEGQSATDNNVGGTEQATDGMYANIPTGQTFENPYTAAQMNAARRAVKNFDMLTSDQKGRILRWMQSIEGKGIDADVVSGVANIIRLRPDLQVMLAETREGVGGFRKDAVAGRNLIVIPSGKDNDILLESIAHELGHDVESAEGFDELKKAAVKATKEEDIKLWETLYKDYPDPDVEVAMKALGRRLATPRFIQRYANKSMLGHLIDSCKQMIDKLRADDARKLEIETAKKLMRMLDGALVADNVHALEKNAGKKQYALQSKKDPTKLDPRTVTRDDVLEMLENAENGMYDDNTYIPIRISTPAIVIQMAKEKLNKVIPNYPLIMSAGKAINAMERQGYGDDGLPNRLAPEEIVNIIEAMSNPLYVVYEQETQEHPEPRYVEVVKFDLENGRKAFAVLELTGENKDAVYINGYEGGQYNVFVTVYPPKDYKLKELLTNKNNVVIYDKKKDFSQRTSGITVPSVLNDPSFFTNSIPQSEEKSTPSAKKTYNLTPEAAEQAARDAAEVEQFMIDEALNERADEAAAEIVLEDAEKTLRQAERERRTSDIQRIEVMARDNNEVYWKYDDVGSAMKEMRKEASLRLRDPGELTFEIYRALNHIRRRLEGRELESTLDGLFDLVADIYEQQTGKSFRTSVKQSNAIDAALRKLYEEKAKQTPRDKQRQRVDYAEGQAKLKTLLDRIDRRRATLKKSKGSLANKEWQNLVEAAHRIRPRFELSYDGIKNFIDTFIVFADHQASVAVSAAKASLDAKTDADAERAAQEFKKFAEERTAGQNQLLDFIDPKLMEAMLTLQGAMTPGKDAEGNDIEVKKLITPAMLDAASSGIQRMLAMDSRVDKIFRNGRWEHVETVSGEMLNKYSYAYRGRTAKSETRKVLRELIRNGIMAAVDPETAVHLVEGVFGDTTLSEGIHIIKMAYEIARNDRDKWLKQFDDFQKDKAHKAWRKAWNEGEMTLKWASYTIDGKPVTQEITVTKQEAAQLYMTSKRTQARAALALGRLEFSETTGKGGRRLAVRKVGVSNETVDQMLSMEEGELNSLMLKMEQAADMAVNDLYRQFSAEDKQYIKLMEKFYNGTFKNVKKICDTEYYGYTNVIDGYYVPISRGDTTYDIDLIASRMRSANDVSVSGYSFNYATVKGARSRLVIGSAQSVLERHAQQLSLYKNMTHPLQNIQRLYNYRQSSATDNVYSVREFIHDYAWDGMDAYLSNYFKDVQGMRTAYDTTSQVFRKAKGGYAKAVLGLNLASGIKQLSSFLQLPGVASIKAVMRGLSPELIRSSRKEIDKYSKLAENRHSNVEMYYAAGASGKVGAVGDVLMKHLELGDRAATVLFWSVAQSQAEIDGKGAVGTESNKEYAGKLVDKWILLIQDTSAPTTKSALARHPQELVSAMTMFQSSAMKIFSRAVNSIHELYLLGQMAKRTDLSSEEKARVKEAQEKAGKAAAVLGGTILAAATFESIVGLIRDKIRGNDDEEESDAKRIAIDTMLNVMGTVPVLGGFAESAFSGYDITEFYTDFLNDGITATRNMANVTAKVAAGEAVESEDILKALKGVTVFSGQLMGIPVNNAMNIVKSTLNMTAPGAAYRYEAMFYEPTYTADLAKALKSGKTALAETIYRMAQKDIKTGGAAADAVVSEMVRLYGLEYNVLPRSAPTTYEDAEGNTVKLKAAQVRRFSEIYGTADGVAAMVATSPVYAGLSDELKAKALRVSYEVYHSRAKSEVLGSDLSVIAALSYLEDYIDVPTLISESAYIYGIKSTKDAKRSELVKSYISGYSAEAQAILLYAAGYRSEQVKELLASVVASLDEDVQNRVKKVLDF